MIDYRSKVNCSEVKTPAFLVVTVVSVVSMFGTAVPSPLYPTYQGLWNFSPFILTVIFAVYVLTLLMTLLVVGNLSDHLGRRYVLMLGLGLTAGAMVIFATAGGVADLVVARAVQGGATGLIVGAISVTLVELQPSARLGSLAIAAAPTVGLGFGAIVTGLLVEFAPAPRQLVYLLLLGTILLLMVALNRLPETSPILGFESRRHFVRSLRPDVSVPKQTRRTFFAFSFAMVAIWALCGLQLSLGSSIVRVLDPSSPLAPSFASGLFFLVGALSSALATSSSTRVGMALGLLCLAAGLFAMLAGIVYSDNLLYVGGSALTGSGFGSSFVSLIAGLSAITTPESRRQVFASMFVVSYTGFSVPALVAGIVATHIGLRPTAVVYVVILVVLVGLAGVASVYAREPAEPTRPR
ncbi:MFS transporter [Rhodococcus sp. MEB064]|uniref:MFS transporter n=1 Tax=Rhodococcus sp. MEB064 TaxID=1587522 RepID=UPI0012E08F33|nr:MFS transporter [Rhodococcus sp. MEB064]